MIAKITTGKGFGGTLDYDRDKGHKNEKQVTLLDAKGVDMNYRSDGKMDPDYKAILRSFQLQAGLNPKVTKPVVHIALSFHPKDGPRLSNDYMVKIAREYMDRMGFGNTQYIIHRHEETNNPHLHILLNRVDNDGNRIPDKFERKRSAEICRDITIREGLAWGRSRSLQMEQGRFSLVEPENEKEKKTEHSTAEVLEAGVSLGLSLFGGGGSKQEEEEFEMKRGMRR